MCRWFQYELTYNMCSLLNPMSKQFGFFKTGKKAYKIFAGKEKMLMENLVSSSLEMLPIISKRNFEQYFLCCLYKVSI